MSLADPFLSISEDFGSLARALEDEGARAMQAAAARAVEILRADWPVDTGASRDAWSWEPTVNGAIIKCTTTYSSFTFVKGDEERMPIYIERLPAAIRQAMEEVGVVGVFEDVTAAYFGEGRTTTEVQTSDGAIGVNRKLGRHTPKKQLEAWVSRCPELVTNVTLVWRGKLVEDVLVPSDTLPAGQATPMGRVRVGRRTRG